MQIYDLHPICSQQLTQSRVLAALPIRYVNFKLIAKCWALNESGNPLSCLRLLNVVLIPYSNTIISFACKSIYCHFNYRKCDFKLELFQMSFKSTCFLFISFNVPPFLLYSGNWIGWKLSTFHILTAVPRMLSIRIVNFFSQVEFHGKAHFM